MGVDLERRDRGKGGFLITGCHQVYQEINGLALAKHGNRQKKRVAKLEGRMVLPALLEELKGKGQA